MVDLRALKLFTAVVVVATSVFAQDHSSEQSEAQITGAHHHRHRSIAKICFVTDPNQECTTYSYPIVAQNVANFPAIWQPATLLASDSAGQALWSKIASGVPNIPPKGQLNGSTINVTYDSVNDPDCCEWYFLSPALSFGRGPSGSRSNSCHVWRMFHVKGTRLNSQFPLPAPLPPLHR
jgi:hypothetical protein